ncbi:MAG: 16S rRNA (cytidine(1402)-2'-O)-methyltransferase [Bacilli bacterium]|nr:16S rRNA (cytidine(1402)-2'-O)-methyltransferase [Bacilli bacterium]
MTPRALDVLKEVDFVACEDTRNSGSLLKKFGIDKAFISCHEHNEEEASNKIIGLLKEGKKVAYMSDAGYPTVSDPGERLTKRCIEAGIKVSVINGPSAAICGLVGSGLEANHFYFYGFLPSKPSARRKELEALKTREDTIVFYEAPHRIGDTLSDMAKILGEDRKAVVARELTKQHEEYIRGTLGEMALLDESTLIGEMVIIVEKAKTIAKTLSNDEIVDLLKEKLESLSSKEAIKEVAKEQGISKNVVYDVYLENFKN